MKVINKKQFEDSYYIRKKRGFTNIKIAKRLGISERTFYRYKKKYKIKTISKIKEPVRIKKPLKLEKPLKIKVKKKKIREPLYCKYTFSALCEIDSPPYEVEHTFSWVGNPDLTESDIFEHGIKQHEFWANHYLISLDIINRKNVYELK